MLGEERKYKNFILGSLPSNVEAHFVYKDDSPTITKKRFVDHISKSKTMGVYSINDSPLNKDNEKQLHAYLEDLISQHDLLIISDYGHGFLSGETARYISQQSIFTSLNAQINAANIGYHTMNNYRDIDCAIINQTELQHELRDRKSSVEKLMEKLSSILRTKTLVVTRGYSGAKLFNRGKNTFYECPAFANKVIDKIGSGDAMLALISCALKSGFGADLSLFIGSLAAAQVVETIGNSTPVNRMQLLKTFSHAIK